jgi:hypothetical protein
MSKAVRLKFQVSLAHFEVMWTNEVENAMCQDIPTNRVKALYKLLSEKIQVNLS